MVLVLLFYYFVNPFSGSGGTHFYGSEFLVDENVVLVTLNYRLIPFGFMSLESTALPGNQGLKDQRLAMEWVQKHIQSFGGSKSKVTVYGESAGSRRYSPFHKTLPRSRA